MTSKPSNEASSAAVVPTWQLLVTPVQANSLLPPVQVQNVQGAKPAVRNAYVSITNNGLRRFRSPSVASLNPKWEPTPEGGCSLAFPYAAGELVAGRPTLNVQIWESGNFSDEFLGETVLDVQQLLDDLIRSAQSTSPASSPTPITISYPLGPKRVTFELKPRKNETSTEVAAAQGLGSVTVEVTLLMGPSQVVLPAPKAVAAAEPPRPPAESKPAPAAPSTPPAATGKPLDPLVAESAALSAAQSAARATVAPPEQLSAPPPVLSKLPPPPPTGNESYHSPFLVEFVSMDGTAKLDTMLQPFLQALRRTTSSASAAATGSTPSPVSVDIDWKLTGFLSDSTAVDSTIRVLDQWRETIELPSGGNTLSVQSSFPQRRAQWNAATQTQLSSARWEKAALSSKLQISLEARVVGSLVKSPSTETGTPFGSASIALHLIPNSRTTDQTVTLKDTAIRVALKISSGTVKDPTSRPPISTTATTVAQDSATGPSQPATEGTASERASNSDAPERTLEVSVNALMALTSRNHDEMRLPCVKVFAPKDNARRNFQFATPTPSRPTNNPSWVTSEINTKKIDLEGGRLRTLRFVVVDAKDAVGGAEADGGYGEVTVDVATIQDNKCYRKKFPILPCAPAAGRTNGTTAAPPPGGLGFMILTFNTTQTSLLTEFPTAQGTGEDRRHDPSSVESGDLSQSVASCCEGVIAGATGVKHRADGTMRHLAVVAHLWCGEDIKPKTRVNAKVVAVVPPTTRASVNPNWPPSITSSFWIEGYPDLLTSQAPELDGIDGVRFVVLDVGTQPNNADLGLLTEDLYTAEWESDHAHQLYAETFMPFAQLKPTCSGDHLLKLHAAGDATTTEDEGPVGTLRVSANTTGRRSYFASSSAPSQNQARSSSQRRAPTGARTGSLSDQQSIAQIELTVFKALGLTHSTAGQGPKRNVFVRVMGIRDSDLNQTADQPRASAGAATAAPSVLLETPTVSASLAPMWNPPETTVTIYPTQQSFVSLIFQVIDRREDGSETLYGEASLNLLTVQPNKSVERVLKIKPSATGRPQHPAATIGSNRPLGTLSVIINTTDVSTLSVDMIRPSTASRSSPTENASEPARAPARSNTPASGSRPSSAMRRSGSSAPQTLHHSAQADSTRESSTSKLRFDYEHPATSVKDLLRASSGTPQPPSGIQHNVAPREAAKLRRLAREKQDRIAKKEAKLRKHEEYASKELFLHFQKEGLGYAAETLLKNHFLPTTLDKLTVADLETMRITNKVEQQNILRVARDFLQRPVEVSKNVSSMLQAMSPGTLADGSTSKIQAEAGEFPPFTATTATANECARKATIFLSHHSIASPWPKPHSSLAQTLNTSNAAPNRETTLYSIHLDEREGAAPITVEYPHKHEHGFSAKYCPVCLDHVSTSLQGSWQYQELEKIWIGDGVTDHVLVWKPFHKEESLKIEFGLKRKKPDVKVRGKKVNFSIMLWGGDKPVRRVNVEAVPFPTLKAKDIIPEPKPNPQQEIQTREFETKIAQLNANLSLAEEKKSRLAIEQEQDRAIHQLLADIRSFMMDFFEQQRLALEEEEAAARAEIEGTEYEKALDDIFDWEEQSVREVALNAVKREAAAVMREQCGMLEDMEAIARRDVELAEEAARANLSKLLSMFNAQVEKLLHAVKEKEAKAKFRAVEDSLRCPHCRKLDCDFFKKPWKNHWKHHGGALDLKPSEVKEVENLCLLMAQAGEKEYHEHLLNKEAERKERTLKTNLLRYLGITAGPHNHSRKSAGGSVSESGIEGEDVAASAKKLPAPADHSTSVDGMPSPIPAPRGTSPSRGLEDPTIGMKKLPEDPKRPPWQPSSTLNRALYVRDLAAQNEEVLRSKSPQKKRNSDVQAVYKTQAPFVSPGRDSSTTPPLERTEKETTKSKSSARPQTAKPASSRRAESPSWNVRDTPQKLDDTLPSRREESNLGAQVGSSSHGNSNSRTGATPPRYMSLSRREERAKEKARLAAEKAGVKPARYRVVVVVLAATNLVLPEGTTSPLVTVNRINMKDDPSVVESSILRGGVHYTNSNPSLGQFIARSNGTSGVKTTFLEAFSMNDVDLQSEVLRVQCWGLQLNAAGGGAAPTSATSTKKRVGVPQAQGSGRGAEAEGGRSILLAELQPSVYWLKDQLNESNGFVSEAFFPLSYVPGLTLPPTAEGGRPFPQLQLRVTATLQDQ